MPILHHRIHPKNKQKLCESLVRWANFFAGNILYTLAIHLFFAPNRIVAGGFGGIATVLHEIIPIPIGTWAVLLNVPLLIWSFFAFGMKYTAGTMLAIVTYGIFANLFAALPCITHNMILAAICGGVMYGCAATCMTKSNTSAGGDDLITRLLMRHFPSITYGRMILVVDAFCIAFAIATYRNIELGLWGILTIFIISVCADQISAGLKKAMICYIITDQDPMKISKPIMLELRRGVTCQKGTGMFSGGEKNILMVTLRSREVYRLKTLVYRQDPTAFVVVALASEVQGGGFQEVSGAYQGLEKDFSEA